MLIINNNRSELGFKQLNIVPVSYEGDSKYLSFEDCHQLTTVISGPVRRSSNVGECVGHCSFPGLYFQHNTDREGHPLREVYCKMSLHGAGECVSDRDETTYLDKFPVAASYLFRPHNGIGYRPSKFVVSSNDDANHIKISTSFLGRLDTVTGQNDDVKTYVLSPEFYYPRFSGEAVFAKVKSLSRFNHSSIAELYNNGFPISPSEEEIRYIKMDEAAVPPSYTGTVLNVESEDGLRKILHPFFHQRQYIQSLTNVDSFGGPRTSALETMKTSSIWRHILNVYDEKGIVGISDYAQMFPRYLGLLKKNATEMAALDIPDSSACTFLTDFMSAEVDGESYHSQMDPSTGKSTHYLSYSNAALTLYGLFILDKDTIADSFYFNTYTCLRDDQVSSGQVFKIIGDESVKSKVTNFVSRINDEQIGEVTIGVGYDYSKASAKLMVPEEILSFVNIIDVEKATPENALVYGIIDSLDAFPEGEFVYLDSISIPHTVYDKINLATFMSPAYLNAPNRKEIKEIISEYVSHVIYQSRGLKAFESLGTFWAYDANPMDDMINLLKKYSVISNPTKIMEALSIIEGVSLCPDSVTKGSKVFRDRSLVSTLNKLGVIPRAASLESFSPRTYAVSYNHSNGLATLTISGLDEDIVISHKRPSVIPTSIQTDGTFIMVLVVLGLASFVGQSVVEAGKYLSLYEESDDNVRLNLAGKLSIPANLASQCGFNFISSSPLRVAHTLLNYII